METALFGITGIEILAHLKGKKSRRVNSDKLEATMTFERNPQQCSALPEYRL
jgi:hypothetical protein